MPDHARRRLHIACEIDRALDHVLFVDNGLDLAPDLESALRTAVVQLIKNPDILLLFVATNFAREKCRAKCLENKLLHPGVLC